MKIKVDKKEYEQLLETVEDLKLEVKSMKAFERNIGRRLNEYLDNFFENKCRVVFFEREKGMIEAQIKQNMIDKLFGGEK